MNKATIEILKNLAITGRAVISFHRANEMKAYEQLKAEGIVHQVEQKHGYCIIAFGSVHLKDTINVRTYC